MTIWDKQTTYHLQSCINDVGGFMTLYGDITPFDVVKDVLQIRVKDNTPEFNIEHVLRVLKNILHKDIPPKNIKLIYTL